MINDMKTIYLIHKQNMVNLLFFFFHIKGHVIEWFFIYHHLERWKWWYIFSIRYCLTYGKQGLNSINKLGHHNQVIALLYQLFVELIPFALLSSVVVLYFHTNTNNLQQWSSLFDSNMVATAIAPTNCCLFELNAFFLQTMMTGDVDCRNTYTHFVFLLFLLFIWCWNEENYDWIDLSFCAIAWRVD